MWPPVYTGLHQYTGRDCLGFRDFGLWASDANFWGLFPGLLADPSEQARETSQTAAT